MLRLLLGKSLGFPTSLGYDQRGPKFALASGRDPTLVNKTSDFVKKFVSVGSLRSARRSLNFSRKRTFRQIQMESSENVNVRGALIVLEGLDRSGKTSQCSRLHSYLAEQGIPAELWRFPDRNTCVGQMISSYLANKSQLDDQAVHLLFSANRWEKRSLMENKLKSGTTLIVDRYSYSGVAFTSAKGLDIEWCKAPERGLLAPDLVLYLDISPEEAAKRGGYGGERYEQLEFQRKVSQQYRILRDGTWQIIDACLPVEDVEKQLRKLVFDCIIACRNGKSLSPLLLK
ncbi:hypothetical protein Scep_025057 [Stephania cephalantha]|uniref:Thymidylate kinase n=1 Tax=Stephania cephalantha TaxID=152367 RepID=A0AAP0F377_9MAGN